MKNKIINIFNLILKLIISLFAILSFKRKKIVDEDKFIKNIKYNKKDIYDNVNFKLKRNKLDLSIIIPVYNSEKYLNNCLNSILNQKTKYSYEVICVNDGSKDSSLTILESYSKEYSNLKIINQENKGISGARNTGIDNALGKYIGFIDNDDYVIDNYVELLLNRAFDKNADIVKCNHVNYLSNKDNKILSIIRHNDFSYNGKMTSEILEFKGYIWGGIFKKEIFNDIRFPLGYWYEDMIMRLVLMRKARQFEYIDENLYWYNVHDTNASKIVWKNNDIKCLDQYFLTKNLLEHSKKIILLDNGEVYPILQQELGNVLWLRTRKLNSTIRKKIFYLSCDLINEYSNEYKFSNFESKILKKAFDNKDYILWYLISLHMMIKIKFK